MKKILSAYLSLLLCFPLLGCQSNKENAQIVATTLPVYEFTTALCRETDLTVSRLITEDVSCLHDYTLQVSQMRALEAAEAVVISGAGLEAFLDDVLPTKNNIIDSSTGIPLKYSAEYQEHNHSHQHETDGHIWLSPDNAIIMAGNICLGLSQRYPQYADTFQSNLNLLETKLAELKSYGQLHLKNLSQRELITFHNGFFYFAESFDLHIVYAIEEESGSEASAAELIDLTNIVKQHQLKSIFIESNGSTAAAEIISAEAGVKIYRLDMAMSEKSYFEAMKHNIDTLKEALE